MRHNRFLVFVALIAVTGVGLSGCSPIPPALDVYAKTDLPGRNAGKYSPLIPELRGELVLNDAAAACSVALAQGKKEDVDPACICTHSSQADWQQKCQAWFQTAPGDGGAPSGADAGTPPSDAGGG